MSIEEYEWPPEKPPEEEWEKVAKGLCKILSEQALRNMHEKYAPELPQWEDVKLDVDYDDKTDQLDVIIGLVKDRRTILACNFRHMHLEGVWLNACGSAKLLNQLSIERRRIIANCFIAEQIQNRTQYRIWSDIGSDHSDCDDDLGPPSMRDLLDFLGQNECQYLKELYRRMFHGSLKTG